MGRSRRFHASSPSMRRALPPGAWPNWVARQSRPAARRDPPRAGASAGRHGAAADAARHADALLCRRAGPSERADTAGSRARSLRPQHARRHARTRSRAHAHAVGRLFERRLHRRRTLAAARGGCGGDQRRGAETRSPFHALADPVSLALRRREPALSIGDWKPLAAADGTLAFMRTWQDRRIIVALDLESKAKSVGLSDANGGQIQFSTNPERIGETVRGDLRLDADEAVVIAAAP